MAFYVNRLSAMRTPGGEGRWTLGSRAFGEPPGTDEICLLLTGTMVGMFPEVNDG